MSSQRQFGTAVAITFFIVAPAVIGTWQWAQSRRPIDVSDGFEGPRLSDAWDTSRFAPGAVTMQSEVVRAGRGAAKIVLHTHEVFEAGTDGDADSERAELQEARRFVSKEQVTYEYSFSIFLPPDFPIVPTRLVIAQWKQYCNGHSACSNDSPVVAIRYRSGVLQITRQNERHRTVLFETKDEVRGEWMDFRFRLRFSAKADGSIKAWLGGKQVVDYTGATAYPENAATGYANPGHFYFKTGLYRDVMPTPMTIYIDEYRKKELPDQP